MSAAFRNRAEPSDFLETSGSMFPDRANDPSLQELAIVMEDRKRLLQIVAENPDCAEEGHTPVEVAIHKHANFLTVESITRTLDEEATATSIAALEYRVDVLAKRVGELEQYKAEVELHRRNVWDALRALKDAICNGSTHIQWPPVERAGIVS